ncbi:MAG: hypothetical protein WDM91_10990 [Rhizomicrobium sp.]
MSLRTPHEIAHPPAIVRPATLAVGTVFFFWGRPLRVERVQGTDPAAPVIVEELAVRATTAEFTERGQAVRELDLRVCQATGIAKAKQVAQFVRLIVEAGEAAQIVDPHLGVTVVNTDDTGLQALVKRYLSVPKKARGGA